MFFVKQTFRFENIRFIKLIEDFHYYSSRSHLIFMINVEGHDQASGAITTGTLTLCDLAGSERVGKTEAQGQRLVEAAAINKSLSSLGQVSLDKI
jgi:hypothetical protein